MLEQARPGDDEGSWRPHGGLLRQVRCPQLRLSHPGDPQRGMVERYIRDRFAASHGAQITHFLPQLLSVGRADAPCAAVGMAPAAAGPLFAEQYLQGPIEQLISEQLGKPVARSAVVEIGNLASTWRGGSLLLFVVLSELIDRLGHRYAVFTATPEVERALARLGYAATVLAPADPARLADAGRSWGRYYLRQPRVVFGEAPPAIAAARRRLGYRLLLRSLQGQIAQLLDRHSVEHQPNALPATS